MNYYAKLKIIKKKLDDMKTIKCQYKINRKICGKEFQAKTRNTKCCPECQKLRKKAWNKKHNEKDKQEQNKIRKAEKYKKLKEQYELDVDDKVVGVKKMKWSKIKPTLS